MSNINETLIKEGANLLKVLDKSVIIPVAFFWFYLPENESWRLVVASEYFDKHIPAENYKKLLEVCGNEVSFKNIGISNISLIPTSNMLVHLLGTAIKTNKDSTAGIRFTKNVINNIFVEDAYIYRLS